MDQQKIKISAERLESHLIKYATQDEEARSLLNALSSFISAAKTKAITSPVEWREIPGAYFFSEGGLRKYSDLEEAYAVFKIEITGGETPALQAIRQQIGDV